MTAATRARVIHNIVLGSATAGLVALANTLQAYSAAVQAHPVAIKSVLVGVLAAGASTGIGIFVANVMKDDSPTPPSSPNP